MSSNFSLSNVFLLLCWVQRRYPLADLFNDLGLLFYGQFEYGLDNLHYGQNGHDLIS